MLLSCSVSTVFCFFRQALRTGIKATAAFQPKTFSRIQKLRAYMEENGDVI